MAILSGKDILALQNKDNDFISPFLEQNIQPASYDLRLGRVVKAGSRKIDDNEKRISIEPNNWALVKSMECLKLPNNICARYGIVSSIARQGIIHFGGPQIDPGYCGCLFTAIFNPTLETVIIDLDNDFFTIEFSELKNASDGYNGRYQGQRDFPSDELQRMMNMKTKDLAHVITTVDRLEEGMISLKEDVHAIRASMDSAKSFFAAFSGMTSLLKKLKAVFVLIVLGILGALVNYLFDEWIKPFL